MEKSVNILVTAVGGDIGQSIVRILKKWNKTKKIIGTDINDESIGKYFVDSFYTVPVANDSSYTDNIINIVVKEKIDIILPINEDEIIEFHRVKQENEILLSKLVMAEGKSLTKCFDKFECIDLIKSFGLLAPLTKKADVAPLHYPCILKSRRGSGSKSVRLIYNEDDYNYFYKGDPDLLIQELLEPISEEYTCGVYRANGEDAQTLILKRKLSGGLTGFAEAVWDKEIDIYCKKIADGLDLNGSINVQMIKTNEGPKLFEINPRFSSTAIFRDHIGFRDVIWSIQDKIGDVKDETFSYKAAIGKKFYRVYSEIFI